MDNTATAVNGTERYFAGAWWGIQLQTSRVEEGLPKSDVGIHLSAGLPPGVIRADSGLVGDDAGGPLVSFKLAVAAASGAGGQTWESAAAVPAGTPFKFMHDPEGLYLWGWQSFPFKAAMPDGSPIHRSNFRSAASPILRDGKMRVRVNVKFL